MPNTTDAPATGRSTHLHQLLAVRDGARSLADKAVTKAYHTIQKAEPLGGIQRTHQSRIDGEQNLPEEYKHVQINAETVADDFAQAMSRLFDVTAACDWTNRDAVANVVLPDGTVLIEAAPAVYLIFLEKKLVDVRTFVEKLPVLDPAIEWNSPIAPGEPYRSRTVETTSTKKVPRNHVRAEATEHHPAQVDMYQEDIVSGVWTTVKLSGALPTATVVAMKDRVNTLIEAVQIARGNANQTEALDPKPGKKVFDYLFADIG